MYGRLFANRENANSAIHAAFSQTQVTHAHMSAEPTAASTDH